MQAVRSQIRDAQFLGIKKFKRYLPGVQGLAVHWEADFTETLAGFDGAISARMLR